MALHDSPHHAVPLTDPLETEKLIINIVEAAAVDRDRAREIVDALTGDQIVAIARAAQAFMPNIIAGGPRGESDFMKLLGAAMSGAAIEWCTDYLVTQIQAPGMAEPRRVRIIIVPEESRIRIGGASRGPLGKRNVKHGG